jgi:hypothetical protein
MVAYMALKALADQNSFPVDELPKAMKKLGIDSAKSNPAIT